MKRPVIIHTHGPDKGKPVVLNAKELAAVRRFQREWKHKFENDLGFEIDITTLTGIIKQVSQQKFFHVAPADYVPIRVGENPWTSNITTYRSFDVADQFEDGLINNGGENARLAMANTAIDSVSRRVFNWAKSIAWNIFELKQAQLSNNWDLVTAKESARKRNWDLGIQKTMFLGSQGNNGADGACLGLLNQPGVTVITDFITKPIGSMTTAELKAFVAGLIEKFRANCNRTAWPTHFVIPESDYNSLAATVSPDFPIRTILDLLTEAFQITTNNKQFKILPVAYADAPYHTGVPVIEGLQVYCLYSYDEQSIRADIPLNYTSTQANSLDNFSLQNVGYGQFTGVQMIRPLEMVRFQYEAS